MMKVCRFLLFLSLLSAMFSCSNESNRIVIEGEIDGLKMADFYVYCDEGIVPAVDTVKIINGEFRYERELSEPAIITFLYPNFSRTFLVAEPGKNLKVKGQASRLSGIDISGSKENELLSKFRLQNLEKSDKDLEMAAAQFVRDHAQTMAAVAVFKRFFEQPGKLNATVAIPLLNQLKKAQPENKTVAAIDLSLRPLLLTSEGSKVPEFSTVTISGDTLTNKSLEGKPSLIVFWSSWINNSSSVLRAVHKVEEKYEGKMNILLVVVDYSKKDCKFRANRERLSCHMICEERGFEGDLVKTLGVRYVPGNLLLNADGEIETRDVPFDRLINSVSDLMK